MGFTLIELALVLFIIGLLIATVAPKLGGFADGDLKPSSRRLIHTVQLLADRSIATKRNHRLNYDLAEQRYWATVLSDEGEFVPVDPAVMRPVRLKEPVRIADVTTLRQGKIAEGQAYTEFDRSGRVDKTLLHLSAGDRKTLTLEVHPLLGRVKVLEGYVEIE
jgi:type II secretory pathway pseudopilin PulG